MGHEDPFQCLGLPRRFDLSLGEIQRAHLARARELHPDAGGEPDDEAAAFINDAKRVLEDPERRANALLALLAPDGVGAAADERALPDGFLMEMMQTREQAEEGVRSGDPAELAKWERWAAQRRAEHVRTIGTLFASLDHDAPDGATLRGVRLELNAWRYIERMLEQLDPETDDLAL